MALDPQLVKLLIIKGAKCRRLSAQSPDQLELGGTDVDDKPEPRLLPKRESILGFVLHVNEGISRRQKDRVQARAAIRRKSEVAGLVRRLEPATQQITARLDMFCPRHDLISEADIGPGLEPLQPAFFDQIIAELAEAKCDLVITEMRSGDTATQPYIGAARSVAVAMLEAEIHDPTEDQGYKVHIRKQGRCRDFGQHVKQSEGCRIAHHRKIDEVLDRTAPKLCPDLRVFASHVLCCRMR